MCGERDKSERERDGGSVCVCFREEWVIGSEKDRVRDRERKCVREKGVSERKWERYRVRDREKVCVRDRNEWEEVREIEEEKKLKLEAQTIVRPGGEI